MSRTTARPARTHSRRRAFSLIELVIVIVVVGTLAAIAVPRFASATARYEAETAARRLADDLRFCQERARTTSKPWRVVVKENGVGYDVEAVPDSELSAQDIPRENTTSEITIDGGNVTIVGSAEAPLGRGADLRKVEFADASAIRIDGSVATTVTQRTIVFNAFGLPSRAVTLSITVGSHTRAVAISTNGEITEQ